MVAFATPQSCYVAVDLHIRRARSSSFRSKPCSEGYVVSAMDHYRVGGNADFSGWRPAVPLGRQAYEVNNDYDVLCCTQFEYAPPSMNFATAALLTENKAQGVTFTHLMIGVAVNAMVTLTIVKMMQSSRKTKDYH